MKLVKAMATVAGLTGVSRVAGFIRDVLTAVILGAGPVSDAFFVALKLPNFFRRVTAEGAFSVSFVPLYSETLEKEGEKSASAFADNTFAVMLWVMLGVTLVTVVFMPYVLYLIAPGFKGDVSRYPMAVEMARTTFPYLMLMSLTALMGGVLNAHNRFAPFAAAPILFNMCLIFFLLISGAFKTAGHAMAMGVFFAGFLQAGLLWHFLKKYGLPIHFVKPDFEEGKLRRLLKLMGPGVLGAGVMHVNLFADLIIASFLSTGSISYLYYADRLNQLPLGMVGIAVGTALLPMMSKALAAGGGKEAFQLFNRAMEICMLFALPAAVGLFMTALPVIMTLFQHGEFSRFDVQQTTFVLTAYALGMPAYIAVKVYSTSYWAKQDTMTPVKASIISTVFNIIVSILLVTVFNTGVMGIAIGTALAGWLQIVLLARWLKGTPETKLGRRFKSSLGKIVLSCAVMGVYLHFMRAPLADIYIKNDILWQQIGGLIILVGGGAVIYGAGVILTGVVKPNEVKKLFKKENIEKA